VKEIVLIGENSLYSRVRISRPNGILKCNIDFTYKNNSGDAVVTKNFSFNCHSPTDFSSRLEGILKPMFNKSLIKYKYIYSASYFSSFEGEEKYVLLFKEPNFICLKENKISFDDVYMFGVSEDKIKAIEEYFESEVDKFNSKSTMESTGQE